MSFNLRSIKTLDTFPFEIKDPDGKPTGVKIILAGPMHPVRKAVAHAAQRKMISSARRNGQVELPDPEETEKERAANLAKFTLGWEGYADENGPVPHSEATALALYADPEMAWLADQVDAALANKQLFTKSAGTN
jgi:hypothetical protein